MNKKSRLWKNIFEVKKFSIEKDVHFISADDIKAITREEPRVMAKIDSTADLPEILKTHGYFILPVKNGQYAIVRGQGFHNLEPQISPTDHVSRINFHLTTAARGSGEMQYLDYSFYSGAIEKVIGESPLYQSIRGREFSKAFEFRVAQTSLKVTSVQLEVDSGLEGENAIVLIEAKMNRPEDFIIRQLFYPFKHFQIVSPQKRLIPVFFTYSPQNLTYNFWIYEFTDPACYNSIRLKKTQSLRIITRYELELSDIKNSGKVRKKDLIPQANDLNKVIELVFKVHEGVDTCRQVADYFQFDERQSSYYREAAEALGLVDNKTGRYFLTDFGKKLVDLPIEKRHLFMVNLLSDFDLIKEVFEILHQKSSITFEDLERIISQSSNLNVSTIKRRAGSLSSWMKWIAHATGAILVEKNTFRLKSKS